MKHRFLMKGMICYCLICGVNNMLNDLSVYICLFIISKSFALPWPHKYI
jgi:hypothetical protein